MNAENAVVSPTSSDALQSVLVLQGGGALGAYQAGVYEALAAEGHAPDWVAGISIGAINAAIIVGNAPENRVRKLRAFWDGVSHELLYRLDVGNGFARRAFNETSAAWAATFGIPGFFTPRLPTPLPEWPNELDRLSYYDTTPLRQTLLDLVDFDRINHGETRFSVGAVNMMTGNFAYFDNDADRKIGPEHIMASGALPPGFPPVQIDGEWYWDGGLVSNTPLQYVLDNRSPCEMTIFQVDLFPSRGAVPKTMADIAQREKDIRFSSRTRMNTDLSKRLQEMRAAAQRLARKLPDDMCDDPDLHQLLGCRPAGAVAVMHLINRPRGYETMSKDYEFSRMTVTEHWEAGKADALWSLRKADWTGRALKPDEIMTFDLSADRPRNGH